MPYSKKEKKLLAALIKRYGEKKGESVYHDMEAEAAKGEKFTKLFSARSKKHRRAKMARG